MLPPPSLTVNVAVVIVEILIASLNAAVIAVFIATPAAPLAGLVELTAGGVVSVAVIQEKSLGYLLAGTLPHGILELPALIIGEAAAFSFGTAVMLALVNRERRKLVLPNLRQNIRYLALAVILLFPAALIETYVTPLLVR